jgi:hypothetical protein
VRSRSLGKLCPFLPYIDLVNGKLQECQATEPLVKIREKDKFAILIEFLGYGADDPTRPLGLDVCRALQGIPFFDCA